jgi:hypothetical protein
MPISYYPRPSYPLAPKSLREILIGAVPRNYARKKGADAIFYCNLDAEAWKTFSSDECQQLGREIVGVVSAAILDLPVRILRRAVPMVLTKTIVADLELERRTYNCLCRVLQAGLVADLEELPYRTIEKLLEIRGFGAKCLVDLLTSVEGAERGARCREAIADASPGRIEDVASALNLAKAFPRAFADRVYRSSAFRRMRLPILPPGVKLSDLRLGERTFFCLTREGFQNRMGDLQNLTVAEALDIRGFGIKSLVEYFAAVDRLRQEDPGNSQASIVHANPNNEACLKQIPLFLEDEIRDLFIHDLGPRQAARVHRNFDILAAFYGLDGQGGATTLTKVADRFGLSKERVRQVCRRSLQRLSVPTSLPPRLREALNLIASRLPSHADSLEQCLQNDGFSRLPFRLEGLMQVAKILGQAPPFDLCVAGGKRIAVKSGDTRLAKQLALVARKVISRFGVATVNEIAAILSDKLSCEVPTEAAQNLLQVNGEFEWLDSNAGWFWLRNVQRNRVVNRIRKILSVAVGVQVGELRAGIARHHEMDSYAPPRRVLLELCRRLPFCKVTDTYVEAQPAIDWRAVLRGIESMLVTVLKRHGSVMQRAELERHCLVLGMKRSTFCIYLNYSPIIDRLAPGVYGIRGAKVEPGQVEALIPRGQRLRNVRLDHGWTADRRIWIGYRLSDAMLSGGVFSVPPGVKALLSGSYSLRTSEGLTVDTVVVKGNTGWGLGTLFRRRGGESGDILVLVFDSKAQEVIASIGDDRLLEAQDPNEN